MSLLTIDLEQSTVDLQSNGRSLNKDARMKQSA